MYSRNRTFMKRIIFALIALLAITMSVSAQMKKIKVLIDNDFCGDPDGLFVLLQHALLPTTEIVGIVSGHLNENAGFTNRKDQATESVEKTNDLLDAMGMKGKFKVVPGSETLMTCSDKIIGSEGSKLIVEEVKNVLQRNFFMCCAELH